MAAFWENLARRLPPAAFMKVISLYPPFLGAGIAVTKVAPDLSSLEVQMKLRPYNRNFVGTQFGGSLYAMCDPFFMILLIQQLGKGYVVWDKSASIDFLKPGRGTVTARFELPPEKVASLRAEVDAQGKINPTFQVTVVDEKQEPVARVTKVLSIRRKEPSRLGVVP